jgi:hypothetical protein
MSPLCPLCRRTRGVGSEPRRSVGGLLIRERGREIGLGQDKVRLGGGPLVVLTAHAAFQLRQVLFLAQVVILRACHCLAQDKAEMLRRTARIKC